LLKVPLLFVISPSAKSSVASLLVNITVNVPSLVVEPSLTALLPLVAVIVIVGLVLSYVQLNCAAAVLLFPYASVKTAAPTSMVADPSAAGVKVAVYTVVDVSERLPNVPLSTELRSPSAYSSLSSLLLNITVNVPSLVVEPSLTALLPLVAVIVIVGLVPSSVQLNCVAAVLLFPYASVNALSATSMVAAPSAEGVNVAVYTVEDVEEKSLKLPLSTEISPSAKLVVALLLVNVPVNVLSLVVEPSLTALLPLVAVIVIVGLVPSYVQLNCAAAVLLFPYASVNALSATSMVAAPSAVGVKVAVYTVVDVSERLPNVPLVTVISSALTKSVVASLDVKVSESVASLDVNGSDPSLAVIVIVGLVPSYVQLNCAAAVLLFPSASVNALSATSIVAAPSAAGVKVAVYTVEDVEEKSLKSPLSTKISPSTKSSVGSLLVNVTVKVLSLVVEPSLTALLPLVAVIVIVGSRASAPGELYIAPSIIPRFPLPLKS